MATTRFYTATAPGSLDWIVDRVHARDLPTPITLPAPLSAVTKRYDPAAPAGCEDFLHHWSLELSVSWERARVIEIGSGDPRLVEFFLKRRAREHLVLLEQGHDLGRWSCRYPQTRFYRGSTRTLARISPGRFDWAARLGTPADESENPCIPLGEILRRRGVLFLRVQPGSREEWIRAHAEHERARLRIVGCERLTDGSHLVVSRRQ